MRTAGLEYIASPIFWLQIHGVASEADMSSFDLFRRADSLIEKTILGTHDFKVRLNLGLIFVHVLMGLLHFCDQLRALSGLESIL
jgi:hypothetical protein